MLHCDGPVANMSKCQHVQLQAGGPGAKVRAYSVEIRLECTQYENNDIMLEELGECKDAPEDVLMSFA
jgi:hypothetical protein